MCNPRVMLAVMAILLGQCPGASPAEQANVPTTTLLRVAFSSPLRGVGLFETASGATSGRCVLFTRPTHDAGTSFGPPGAPLSRSGCGNGENLSRIAFTGTGLLIAYGPGLRVSRDLGATWAAPALAGAVAGMTAHGATSWVLSTRCRAGARSCRLTLLRSGSAGSWAPVSPQPPDRAVSGAVTAEAETGESNLLASAPDGAPVLALPGPPPGGSRPGPRMATVETLQPGAARWTSSRVQCATSYFETELSIAADGSEWLACSDEPSTGAQPKSLAVSPGRGKRWSLVAGPCVLGARCTQRMPIGGYLDGLVALSSRTGFYVGSRSSLTGTSDGGRSWHAWQRIGGQDNGTSQVTFAGPRYGWAIAQVDGGGAALWRTTNGGRTWSRA